MLCGEHAGPQHEVQDKKQKKRSTKKAAQSKVVTYPSGEEADLGNAEAPDTANGPMDVPQAQMAGKQPESSVPGQDNRPPAEPGAGAAAEPAADLAATSALADYAATGDADSGVLPTGTEVEPTRKNSKKRKSEKRQQKSEDHVASQRQANDESQISLEPTRKKQKSGKVGACSGIPGSKHTLNVAPTSLLYTVIRPYAEAGDKAAAALLKQQYYFLLEGALTSQLFVPSNLLATLQCSMLQSVRVQ